MPNVSVSKTLIARLPLELGQIVAARTIAVGAVIGVGALAAAALPEGASAWLRASCYLAPASLAFTVRWWLQQGD